MTLDIRTLSVVNTLIAVILGIAMIFIYKTRKTYAGFPLWITAYFCEVIGFLLLSGRDLIPDFWSIIVANPFIFACSLLLMAGLYRFWGREGYWRELALYMLLMIVAVVSTTYIYSDANLRVILVSLLFAFVSAKMAWLFFQNSHREQRPVYWTLGILFLLYALMMMSRAVVTHFGPSMKHFFDANPMQIITFLSQAALSILWTISLIAVHTKRLELELYATQKELKRMVVTDGLTGVYNNRYFYELGHMLALHARRYGEPLSVIIFDIDYFKNINDTYGHQAGDRVLIQVAAVCRRELRDSDILCRLGGDEFGILLPQTHFEGSHAVAERLRTAIAAEDFLEPQIPLHLTVSMGVSLTAPGEEDVEAAMKRADTALYEVKHGPRNQVRMLLPEKVEESLAVEKTQA